VRSFETQPAPEISSRSPLAPSVFIHSGLSLEPGEQVLAVADAVLLAGLREKLNFGVLWNRYQGVRVLITDLRLVEQVRPFGGRAPGCRVRSWRWSQVHSAQISRRTLELHPAGGRRLRWRILDSRAASLVKDALTTMRSLMAGAGTAAEPAPFTLQCPQCAAALPEYPELCPGCATTFVTPRIAGWLAVALPGAGHFATRHYLVGAFRVLFEVTIILALFSSITSEGKFQQVPALALVLIGAIVGIKLEAVFTARAFARLLVPWTARAHRAWAIAGVFGAGLTVAAVISGLVLANRLDQVVNRDLEFHGAEGLGWEASYRPAVIADLSGPILRSTWTHRDRWYIEVFAQPLASFQTAEEWSEFEEALRIGRGLPRGTPIRTGAVDGVRYVTPAPTGDPEIVRIEIVVFDRRHRDVHTVRFDVFNNQVEAADVLLRRLFLRSHWTKAAGPCNTSWRPE